MGNQFFKGHRDTMKTLFCFALCIISAFSAVPKAHYPKGFYNVNPMQMSMKPFRKPVGVLNNGMGGKIVGGSNAKRGEFPWQVSWRQFGSHSCGGSILNENWVLSAGHCCEGILGSGDVVAGGVDIYLPEGVEQHKSITKFKNPDYDSATINNDVCLLKVDSPFEFNDEIGPVPVDTNMEWAADATFTVSGWGTKSEGGLVSEKLQKVNVPHVMPEQCQSNYASSGYDITDGMICAGEAGKDSCQGDSGGPLVAQTENGPVLVGVVSWGIGCARDGYPGVYARVAKYADWIATTISNN